MKIECDILFLIIKCVLGWGDPDLLMDGRGIDLIFFQFAVERVTADSQAVGGLFFVPAAFF